MEVIQRPNIAAELGYGWLLPGSRRAPKSEFLANTSSQNLLSLAEEWNADLIVLVNSDRSVLSRLFFRDMALDIIRDADRALFLAQ
ncbi:MAG: universal stress protein [Planctomycetaceae bacterium]|nr:universal stress protein [Planctomycetaceae bacterium]